MSSPQLTPKRPLPTTTVPHRRGGLRLVPVEPPATADAREVSKAGESIPHPGFAFVKALAERAFEVLAGVRTVTQFGPMISASAARELANVRAMWNERRTVYRDARVPSPRALRARIDRPRHDAAETTVILAVGNRVRAVAMRLEWAHQHWRITSLTVL